MHPMCVFANSPPRPSLDTCRYKLLCRNLSVLCTFLWVLCVSVCVCRTFFVNPHIYHPTMPKIAWREIDARYTSERQIKKDCFHAFLKLISYLRKSLACCQVLRLIERCDFLSACVRELRMTVSSILSITHICCTGGYVQNFWSLRHNV